MVTMARMSDFDRDPIDQLVARYATIRPDRIQEYEITTE